MSSAAPTPTVAVAGLTTEVTEAVAVVAASATFNMPPPPDFYQSRQAYWGNPYSAADSDDDSNDMPASLG